MNESIYGAQPQFKKKKKVIEAKERVHDGTICNFSLMNELHKICFGFSANIIK